MYYATLSFNANGGSGAPSSITNSSSTSTVVFTIPTTKPTRSGYTFAGWELSYTGGSSTYQPGGTAKVEGTTSGITYTLYAIWEEVYTYYATLKFNANGGSGAPSSMTDYNTGSSTITFTIPYTTPTRSGYTFQGWELSYTGGSTIYEPGDTARVEGTTGGITYTLYAVWEEIPTYYATLVFDANGGTGAPSDITNYTEGSSSVVFTIPSTVPTRTGYAFGGWEVTYTGGSTIYQPGDTASVEGTISGITYTLVAVWIENAGGAHIYANGWDSASVYIYANGWIKATPYVYANGWEKGV